MPQTQERLRQARDILVDSRPALQAVHEADPDADHSELDALQERGNAAAVLGLQALALARHAQENEQDNLADQYRVTAVSAAQTAAVAVQELLQRLPEAMRDAERRLRAAASPQREQTLA